jgi:hypothetical protein
MRRALAVILVGLLALPVGGVASARSETLGDLVERELLAAARDAGIGEAAALGSIQAIEFVRSDGSSGVRSITAAEIIRRLDVIPAAGSNSAPGIVDGVPEIVAGDLSHAYIKLGIRLSTLYRVTQSTVVPATPGAVVSDPVTGLPVFTEYGGPLIQVKGGGWDLGLHGAGLGFGGVNVDLAEGGPYVAPVAFGILEDSSIDFAGHGALSQVCVTIPFLGCVIALGFLDGDGLTIFDSDLPAELPVLP